MFETSSTLDKIQEGYALFIEGIDMLVNLQNEEKINNNEYLSNMLQYKIHKAMNKAKEMENALHSDKNNNDSKNLGIFSKKKSNRQKHPIQNHNDLIQNIHKNSPMRIAAPTSHKRKRSRSLERNSSKNKEDYNKACHDFLLDENGQRNSTNQNLVTPKPKPPKPPQKLAKPPKPKVTYTKSPLPKKNNIQKVHSEFALSSTERKIINSTNNKVPHYLKVIFH